MNGADSTQHASQAGIQRIGLSNKNEKDSDILIDMKER